MRKSADMSHVTTLENVELNKAKCHVGYFTLNLSDESKESCSVCAAVVSRGGKEMKNFNTSNMRYHY